ALTFQNHTDCPLTDFGGKTSIFSHPVYLFLRKFSLQDSRGGSLCIDGGKKAKMRPGDVLGALTGDIGLDGADIGKIAVHPAHVYVAVRQAVAHKAWKQLQGGKIKGKTCRVRLLK
ncbi:DbpA RNA binding domain-containing protein, partial [Escherichia coli]|uniref:DbpA RNA binding domain-containing protein n=1 Tax=Escherichia coli TaxID=562 RepID=UPI002026BB73